MSGIGALSSNVFRNWPLFRESLILLENLFHTHVVFTHTESKNREDIAVSKYPISDLLTGQYLWTRKVSQKEDMMFFMWSFAPKTGAKLHGRSKPTIVFILRTFNLDD